VGRKHRELRLLERRLLKRPFKGTGGMVRPIDTDNDSGHFLSPSDRLPDCGGPQPALSRSHPFALAG
jgi:hypothetical protein